MISSSLPYGAPFVGVVVATSSSPLPWSETLSKGESMSSRGVSTSPTSSTSQPHTVSQVPLRKEEFWRGSGTWVVVFLRFEGRSRALSLDGEPRDMRTKKNQTTTGVREEKVALCSTNQSASRLAAVPRACQILPPSSRLSLNAGGLVGRQLSLVSEVSLERRAL